MNGYASATANDSRPKTVVLQQRGGIGDIIWQIPYFREVARKSRGGKVSIITRPSTMARQLIGHEPWVEEIIPYDFARRKFDGGKSSQAGLLGMWRMANELRKRKFDRILVYSDRYARGILAWLAGIPQRAGYGFRPSQRLFLNAPPYIDRHAARTMEVYWEATRFSIAHGFCDRPIVPKLTIPAHCLEKMREELAALPETLFAMTLGTTCPVRQWGAANYAQLSSELLQRGHGVLLVGGKSETQLAQEIRSRIDPASRRNIACLTQNTLMENAAALSIAQACVGNDSGATHLAAACGCPTYMVLLKPYPVFDHDPILHMVHGITGRGPTVAQVLRLLAPHAQRVLAES